MTLAFWYWFFVVLALFWGGFREYRSNSNTFNGVFFAGFGMSLLQFVLFVIIGLKVFGGPIETLVK